MLNYWYYFVAKHVLNEKCISYINSRVTCRRFRGCSLQMWRVTLRADALTNRWWRLRYGDPTSILVQWYRMASRCCWCYRCARVCVYLLCFRSSCRKSRDVVAITLVVVFVVLSHSHSHSLSSACSSGTYIWTYYHLYFFYGDILLQFLHRVSEWPWRGGWKHLAHNSLLRMVEGGRRWWYGRRCLHFVVEKF